MLHSKMNPPYHLGKGSYGVMLTNAKLFYFIVYPLAFMLCFSIKILDKMRKDDFPGINSEFAVRIDNTIFEWAIYCTDYQSDLWLMLC